MAGTLARSPRRRPRGAAASVGRRRARGGGRVLVIAKPRVGALLERRAPAPVEAGGIEAVPIVESHDGVKLRGLDTVDPRRGRLGRAAPAALRFEAARDQIEIGVVTRMKREGAGRGAPRGRPGGG